MIKKVQIVFKLALACAFLCTVEFGFIWYSDSAYDLLFVRVSSENSEIVSASTANFTHYAFPANTTEVYDNISHYALPNTSKQLSITNLRTNSPNNLVSVSSIEENVERCMRMANLNSEPLISEAKVNARYFLDEYRKVIPENGLKGYRSHCWKGNYSTKWQSHTISGTIGSNIDFSFKLSYYPYGLIFSYLTRSFHGGHYRSNVLCLPNVFLLGYEKCGSTFLFGFIDRLISLSTNISANRQISKEPQFWARFEAYQDAKKNVPKVEGLARYLINYIPGMNLVSKQNKTDVMLIDGTPNYMVEWPIFSKGENNMSNYCLLPAALPTLFPRSKYIAIMRNPIDMVYSNFWWSCSKNHIKVPDPVKGPDIFHNRTMSKIQTFNNCMRNASVPSISSPCVLDDSYSACITQRLHLLDQCSDDIIANSFSPELPRCGEITLYYGIFYIHVRKWLSLVGRENLLLLTLEELNQSPDKVANDTLQFLELNRLSSTEIDSFTKMIMITGDKNTQNVKYKTDFKLHMRPDTKLALEILLHPFNLLLAELLDDNKFKWF